MVMPLGHLAPMQVCEGGTEEALCASFSRLAEPLPGEVYMHAWHLNGNTARVERVLFGLVMLSTCSGSALFSSARGHLRSHVALAVWQELLSRGDLKFVRLEHDTRDCRP